MIEYLRRVRRDLHQIPELANKEYKTSAYIKKELDALGVKYREAGTGIIADIAGEDKRFMIAVRSDMDALPIQENSTHDYKSQHAGVMHACGHDGHMAMALALAAYARKNKPLSNLRIIFQPAEESAGGAEAMIEAGALNKVNMIVCLHLSPHYDEGMTATSGGAIMAGALDFKVEFSGRSAHCSRPSDGADALAAAIEYYERALRLVKDEYSKNCLMHIGSLHGGTASNIVANTARADCTFRFFSDSDKESFSMKIAAILVDIYNKHGVDHRLTVNSVYPPVINNTKIVDLVKSFCPEVREAEPSYTGEDFAFYLQKTAGCLAWLGVGSEAHNAPLHSDKFDFDESALTAGLDFYKKILYADNGSGRSVPEGGAYKEIING